MLLQRVSTSGNGHGFISAPATSSCTQTSTTDQQVAELAVEATARALSGLPEHYAHLKRPRNKPFKRPLAARDAVPHGSLLMDPNIMTCVIVDDVLNVLALFLTEDWPATRQPV